MSGKVIMSIGAVTAQTTPQAATNAERTLARGADVFISETLTTGPNAQLQMRMVDDALLSLACNSELVINDYSFAANPAADTIRLQLLSGSLRMVTGTIPEMNRSAFRLAVGSSELTVRGTDFRVTLDADNQSVHFAVIDGGITISNSEGAIDLGIGGDFDFAVVRLNEAPTGLAQQVLQSPSCR